MVSAGWGNRTEQGGISAWKKWGAVTVWSGDFPGGAVVKNPPANAGYIGSSPGLGRSHMLWSN